MSTYQLYINALSPFSSKTSALLGYAGMDCEEVTQNVVNRFATIKRLTGDTMVPVLRRGEWAINDSTQIARFAMERSSRPILPDREPLHALCWLLEDFADEWFSKIVLASRWLNREDRRESRMVIGDELTSGIPVMERMVGKAASFVIRAELEPVGVCEANRAAVERSRGRLLQALESTLEDEPAYLFCGHPTVADFAFFGQWSQFARDVSGARVMRMYPNTRGYLERLDALRVPHPLERPSGGGTRPLESLRELFAEFLGTYWPVLTVNFEAMQHDEPPRRVTAELLDGETFEFEPSNYLVGRLEFVLEHIDKAYGTRRVLFGDEGLEIEHALVTRIARLSRTNAGRRLLRDFPNIGSDQGPT